MALLYLIMLFIITPGIYVKGMPYNYGIYYYPKEMYMVLLTLGVAGYLLYKHKKKELKIDKSYLYLFLALFVIFTIGNFYSITPFFSGRTVGGFFIFIISFIYFYNYKHKKLFIYMLWFVAVLQGIIGITQKIGIYYDVTGIKASKGRLILSGTIGNVNMLSHFMAAVFLIVTYYIFIERKKWIKNSMILGNSFIFYIILVTQTRGSLLAIIIGIALLYFKYYKSKVYRNKNIILKIALGMIVAILIFFITDFKIETFKERTGIEVGINSTRERVFIWRETIELIKEKPLIGHGTGSFIIEEQRVFKKLVNQKEFNIFKNRNSIAAHSHNDYLQIFAENGIFGFLTLLFLVILTIIKFKNSKKYSSGIFFVGVLSYMITACFEFPFHMIHNGVIAFALLGLFVGTIKKKKI